MDAGDRLRRYLEQRRELGETEYVLDGISVESVLEIIGANRPYGSSGRAACQSPHHGETDGGSATGEPNQESGPVRKTTESNSVRIGSSDSFLDRISQLTSLEGVAGHVAECRRCALHALAKNPVPGEGNPSADFMCVGEAPGASEDAQGRPFVGEAGQLLTKILAAIRLTRADVYICNVVKHRPPGNRDPLPDEVSACMPYLKRQVELVRPRVILALGRLAAQTLLGTTSSVGALRGRIHQYSGVPVIVTYHPAALLRNELWKRPTWEDVKLARRVLDDGLTPGNTGLSRTSDGRTS